MGVIHLIFFKFAFNSIRNLPNKILVLCKICHCGKAQRGPGRLRTPTSRVIAMEEVKDHEENGDIMNTGFLYVFGCSLKTLSGHFSFNGAVPYGVLQGCQQAVCPLGGGSSRAHSRWRLGGFGGSHIAEGTLWAGGPDRCPVGPSIRVGTSRQGLWV